MSGYDINKFLETEIEVKRLDKNIQTIIVKDIVNTLDVGDIIYPNELIQIGVVVALASSIQKVEFEVEVFEFGNIKIVNKINPTTIDNGVENKPSE